MVDLFGLRSAAAFGRSLARYWLEMNQVDPDSRTKIRQRYSQAGLEEQVRTFLRASTLNFLSRAYLANEFKWTLRDAGLARERADQLTEWLVLRISTKKVPS